MRFNNGPVVVDEVTAEICRQNFIKALDDFDHPVYATMMQGFTRVSQRHIDCNCYACVWLDRQINPRPKRRKHHSVNNKGKVCNRDGCNKPARARLMCKSHYNYYTRKKNLTT